jgi:nucleotide-binding universal stress UspA family protein
MARRTVEDKLTDQRSPSLILDRVVCAIDETPESLEAVRQAARLRSVEGRLHLFAAVYLVGAVAAGWSERQIDDELEVEAGDTMRRAVAMAGDDVSSRLVNGPAVASLLAELEREQATLLCVGSHSHHRLPGILFGYVSTTMIHEAPCSVLVARTATEPDSFPRSIVVGIDGSPQAAIAYTVAAELARRFDASLRPIADYGGKFIDTDALAEEVPDLSLDRRGPVETLTAAATSADLLVVGSRGLHGLRALGSVSERVAHQATCSVLVVREPTGSHAPRVSAAVASPIPSSRHSSS